MISMKTNKFECIGLTALLLSALFFTALPAMAQSVFDYQNFSSTGGLNLTGGAAQSVSVLRVTTNAGGQQGAAFYNTRVPVGAFNTTFQFQISALTNGGADGFSFNIRAGAAELETGAAGEQGTSDGLAVQFDTFQNTGEPNSNFVRLRLNGATLAENSSLPFNLKDGAVHTAEISLSGGSFTLRLDGTTVITQTGVSLSAISPAYAGFAARTGGSAENHDILSWSFAGSATVNECDFCSILFPSSFSVAGGAQTQLVYGQIFEQGVTEAPGAPAGVTAQLGYGLQGTDPRTADRWTYFPASYNLQVGNNDEYQGTMNAPTICGTYRYVYRYSFDGGAFWSYADLDGAGSNPGLSFDPNQLGTMTVSGNCAANSMITQQPQSATIAYNTGTTLTVAASTTSPPVYQWYRGASGDTGNPVGTNSSSFTTPNLTATTSYWVRVTDSAGSLNSQTAVLTVNPPQTLTVTKAADTNDGDCSPSDCSLREAIAAAQSGNSIQFASPLFDTAQTISINGQLFIDKNLTINGRGANLLTVRNVAAASGTSRVFLITGGTVNLDGMTITGGNLTAGVAANVCGANTPCGGGINNSGNLTITGSVISGNSVNAFSAVSGGGIYSNGNLTITDSTISGNSISSNSFAIGGGISLTSAGYVISNSTISGNSASGNTSDQGGGINVNNGVLNIINSTVTNNSVIRSASGGIGRGTGTVIAVNTIISGNFAPTPPDIGFSLSGSSTNNLIGGNARLLPLGNYGGATPTHALLPDSPAINAGNDCVLNLSCASANPPAALTTDQRGASRVGAVDIGAFELNNSANGGYICRCSSERHRSSLPTITRSFPITVRSHTR